MICHKHKCIFIHVPKTGGTSVERLFVKHETDIMLSGVNVQHKHTTASQMRELYPKEWEQYFTFTIVRNPWDWLVSRFFWSHLNESKTIPTSFNQFINTIDRIREQSKYLRGALDTQISMLSDTEGNIIVNHICKFESLPVDFDYVCDKIGKAKKLLPHTHKTKHKQYTEYYDDETRQIVAERYTKDIELFGYKFGE